MLRSLYKSRASVIRRYTGIGDISPPPQVLEAGLLAQPPAGPQLPHQRAVRGGPEALPPHRRRRPPARPVPGAQPGPQQLVELGSVHIDDLRVTTIVAFACLTRLTSFLIGIFR